MIRNIILSLSCIALVGAALIWQKPLILARLRSEPAKDLVLASPVPPVATTAALTQTAAPALEPQLPPGINLDVPFTSQAPYAVWDALSKEACEEASILMAQWYVDQKRGIETSDNRNLIPPDEVQRSNEELVEWEKNVFSYYEDTNAAETLRTLQEKLGVPNARLTTDISAEAFKRELSRGNLLVVPLAGQLLDNAYFTPPGPVYHMLVIRGYNEKGFITNDPGFRQGEGYVYPEEMLLNAIHDWTGSDETIQSGRKVAIVVEPKS